MYSSMRLGLLPHTTLKSQCISLLQITVADFYLVVCSICWYIYIQEWSLGICSILDLSHDGIYQRHTDLYRHLEVIDTALTRNPKQLGNQIEFSVLTELQQTGWHGRMAASWNMQIWSIFINEQWQLSGIWGSEIYWNCRRVKNVQIIWT